MDSKSWASLLLCITALCVPALASQEGDSTPNRNLLQAPTPSAGYYVGIDASSPNLKRDLQALIYQTKRNLTYDAAWTAFRDTGRYLPGYPCDASDPTRIPDIYSSTCWLPPKDQCGNYKAEGDCYNREHIWPKSWFGGTEALGRGSYTDLFELYPSDGYVNAKRGNDPLGYVSSGKVMYKSTNECLFGPCDAARNFGHSTGNCFELPDDLKGDIARSYFYLATAYYQVWSCCKVEDVVDAYLMSPWLESVMREWHALDPVNDAERGRNDVIYSKLQGNRNPYIDHPEWVDLVSFSQLPSASRFRPRPHLLPPAGIRKGSIIKHKKRGDRKKDWKWAKRV